MKISKKKENEIFDLLFNIISTRHRTQNEYFDFLDGVLDTVYIFNNHKVSDFYKRLELMRKEYE